MSGIIVTAPPVVELPPGSSGGGPISLPPVIYQYAMTGVPQTWIAAQTFTFGNFVLAGQISGTTVVNAAQNAAGSWTVPSATDTFVGRATTDTLTNKTIDGNNNTLLNLPASQITGQLAIANGGTGATSASAAFDALSPTTTRGDLIYRNATTNTRLGAGNAGYLLQTNGAGADPTWSGFLQSGTGAVTRTWQDKAGEYVSAKDFGLSTANTGAQNVTAWNAALAYAVAQGGLTLHMPAGTYDFNATISLTGANNTRITGDGPDATILRITSATADFMASTGDTYYQTIDNLSLTSTVTRTNGAMMNFAFFRRGLIHRVRIQQHFNGINLPGFEQSTLSEVFIVNPSGAGTAITCGTPAATNQGANLNLLNCFLRGFNDVTQVQPPTGLVGISIYDVEAIFAVNTDMGNFLNQVMIIQPTTRAANCHFVQTFFDGTKLGDNVFIAGTGAKEQFQFTGCWFNGAGAITGGSNDCSAVNATNAGTYSDWNFSGCRFLSSSGAGVNVVTRYMDFTFTGCVFTNCGFSAGSADRNAAHFQPAAAALHSPVITGCKFQGSGARDVKIETNADGVVITGCNLEKGILWTDGTRLGGCAGNWDQVASAGVASASTIVVPATIDYVVVTGTTNINKVQTTFPGHKVSFRTVGILTWVDDGNNLRLVGNYVTTGNSVLTLVCEANGDWREVARATS